MPHLSDIPPGAWSALGTIGALVLGILRERWKAADLRAEVVQLRAEVDALKKRRGRRR